MFAGGTIWILGFRSMAIWGRVCGVVQTTLSGGKLRVGVSESLQTAEHASQTRRFKLYGQRSAKGGYMQQLAVLESIAFLQGSLKDLHFAAI